MLFFRTASAAALALWVPTVAMAGDDLTIGDKAPPIDVAHWLKGSAVESFEPGQIYVLEFWATWCASCRANMPHLSELQRKFADYDVTIVGVSDEGLQKVVRFMAKADMEGVVWHDKIQYTLAADPDESTHDAYMRPAAQETIPTAFIIGRDGRIDWIGYPGDMEPALVKVIHNEWDRDAARAEFEEKIAPARVAFKLRDKINEAANVGDWNKAIETAATLVAEQPRYEYLKVGLFRKMLRKADPVLTYKYGRELMQQNWDSSKNLNSLAWYTVDDDGVKQRDLDFALNAAMRANELTGEENAAILDTLARVHFEKGDVELAIKWQQKAVEHAADAAMAADLRETLARYEEASGTKL